MAIATNHSLLEGASGKVGGYVTRTLNKQTVISKAPKGRSKISATEKDNHSRFREASAHAKSQMLDPEIKAYFKTVAKRRKLSNAYTAALAFKLNEMKEEEKRKNAVMTAGQPQDEAATLSEFADDKNFIKICQKTEKEFGSLISQLSAAWRELNSSNCNEKQLDVLRTIIRKGARLHLHFI